MAGLLWSGFPAPPAPLVTCGFDYGSSLRPSREPSGQRFPGPSFWFQPRNPVPASQRGLSFVLANARPTRSFQQGRKGVAGKGVAGAGRCPTCHRAAGRMLAGKEAAPGAGSVQPLSRLLLLTRQLSLTSRPKGQPHCPGTDPGGQGWPLLCLILLGASWVGGDLPHFLQRGLRSQGALRLGSLVASRIRALFTTTVGGLC